MVKLLDPRPGKDEAALGVGKCDLNHMQLATDGLILDL
jgi:hypothetical protein